MKKAFLLLLLLASPLQATTYWVAKTAPNDSAACTAEGSPCLTINGALAKMTAAGGGGHTLNIKVGTYAENLINTIPSGTAGNINTVQAYAGATVTLQPTSDTNPGILLSDKDYIKIDGLIIDGTQCSGDYDGIKIESGNGTSSTPSTNITVTNCEIHHWINQGMILANFTQSCTISNNRIHDNGDIIPPYTNQDHGIYLLGSNNIISGNEIYGELSGSGIQMHNQNGPEDQTLYNNQIIGNKFHDNRVCLIVGYSNNTLIANNICYASQVTGGFFSNHGSPTNDKYFHNTIYTGSPWTSGGTGALYLGATTGAQVRNNIFYGGSAAEQVPSTGTGTTFTKNACGFAQTNVCDPTLILASSPFTSTSTPTLSLTRNVGPGTDLTATTPYAVTTDHVGATRTVPVDVGAYEFVTGSPTISLSSPAAGASWTVGTTQTISFSVQNVTNVDIGLDPEGDGTYGVTIATSYAVASGTNYSWTVTNNPATTCKIRVKNSADSTAAVSGTFEIKTASGGTFTQIISDNTTGTYTQTIPGVSDMYLEQSAPTQNKNNPYIYASKWATSEHTYGLISFDGLSQIPAAATITSVTLGLYMSTSDVGGSNQTLDIRRLLRVPSETTATWTNYTTNPSALAWTTAGGIGAATDRVSATSAQITPITTTPGWVTVTSSSGTAGTLLDDVRKRVNGTYSSLWWHLECSVCLASQSRAFDSSDSANAGQRPYLGVNYTTSAPSITLTQPVGGSHFFPGQQMPISWQSSGISGPVSVYISYNGGTYYQPAAIMTVDYSESDALWPVIGPSGNNIKFKAVSVNDTAVTSESGAITIAGTTLGIKQ